MKTIYNSILLFALMTGSVPLFGQIDLVQSESAAGYLGVGIRDVTKDDVTQLGLPAERGVYITSVQEGTPAEQAGILSGDVLLEYRGMPVWSARQFRRLVSETPEGRHVAIQLHRDGGSKTVTAEISSRGPRMSQDREHMFRLLPDLRRGQGGIHMLPAPPPSHPQGQPRLGIRGDSLTEQLADSLGVTQGAGVLVTEVLPGTPAEAAGLKAGDVIVSANGKEIGSVAELVQQLDSRQVDLEIVRDGQTIKLSAELADTKKGDKGLSIRL